MEREGQAGDSEVREARGSRMEKGRYRLVCKPYACSSLLLAADPSIDRLGVGWLISHRFVEGNGEWETSRERVRNRMREAQTELRKKRSFRLFVPPPPHRPRLIASFCPLSHRTHGVLIRKGLATSPLTRVGRSRRIRAPAPAPISFRRVLALAGTRRHALSNQFPSLFASYVSCLWVYVCLCISFIFYVHVCIFCMQACMYVYVCMHACRYERVYECMYACMSVRTCV